MAVLRTHALILRHSTDREHDRTLTLLTPTMGQQRLRARGTKKSVSKLGGSLEPLTEVDVQFAEGRTMGQVTGSVILDRFGDIRADLVAFIEAQWLLELVERVTKPDQPDRGLYELVMAELRSLPAERDWPLGRRWLALFRRAWRILQHEGFAPAFDTCVVCHQPLTGDARAVLGAGFAHAHEGSADEALLHEQTWRYLSGGDLVGDERRAFREAHAALESIIHRTLERPLKSERVLRSVMRLAKLSP